MEQDQNEEEEDVVEKGLTQTSSKSAKKKSKEDPVTLLHKLAKDEGLELRSKEFATHMDESDSLKGFREEFHFPFRPGTKERCLYFCGNSLGLMPKNARKRIEEELVAWETEGVEGLIFFVCVFFSFPFFSRVAQLISEEKGLGLMQMIL